MIIIIGAGITGLFIGWKCFQNKIPFLIFESSPRVGGRLKSTFTSKNKHPVELGGAFFAENHQNIMSLINDFQIKIQPVSSLPIDYRISLTTTTSHNQNTLNTLNTLPPYTTEFQQVQDVLSSEQKLYRPDYDEIQYMNYNDWKSGEDSNQTIYIAERGIETICQSIYDKIKNFVVLSYPITHIDFKNKIINHIFHGSSIIITCPLSSCKKIEISPINDKWNDLLQTGTSVPSVKVLVEYKTVPDHLNYFRQLVSDDKLYRWYLPLYKSLHLISYVDGDRAQQLIDWGEEKSLSLLYSSLNIKPINIKNHWFSTWNEAITVLQYDLSETFKNQMHQIDKGIYQTFLPHPYYQAWIEGHLLQAQKIIQEIIIDSIKK